MERDHRDAVPTHRRDDRGGGDDEGIAIAIAVGGCVIFVVVFDRCDFGAASSVVVVAVVAAVVVAAAISDSTTATSSDRAESAGRTRERARKRKDGKASTAEEATSSSPPPRNRAVSMRRWIVASPVMVECSGAERERSKKQKTASYYLESD